MAGKRSCCRRWTRSSAPRPKLSWLASRSSQSLMHLFKYLTLDMSQPRLAAVDGAGNQTLLNDECGCQGMESLVTGRAGGAAQNDDTRAAGGESRLSRSPSLSLPLAPVHPPSSCALTPFLGNMPSYLPTRHTNNATNNASSTTLYS
eukprot:626573-Rhodomonas_salina.2